MGQAADQPLHPTVEAWVLASLGRAVAFARSLLQDKSEAEDVVQECFYRLLRRAGEYNLPVDGDRLLFRAVTNACINRTQRRRGFLSLHAEEGQPERGWADRTAARPDQVAEGRELAMALRQALAALPVEQRAAVELKSLGHSQADIAAALGRTPNHVGVLIHRARQTLKAALGQFLQDDEPDAE